MSAPLLQAKLFAPPLPPQPVTRPRLTAQLDAGLGWGSKLSLVSAPAGFGKTTVIRAWLGELERPFAWLSLDESDNDLVRFCQYFIAALRTIHTDIGAGLMEAYQAENEPLPITNPLTALLNELMAQPSPAFVLVLDDYHVIENPEIDDLLTFWLTHQPPHMHLVITSRADPSLPLSRLRSRRQMTELRTADLRFTVEETAVFLQQTFNLQLSHDEIATLEERTEGWIVGLQMAAISLQGSQDAAQFVAAFSGSHRYVLDYLADEVLAQRPSGTKEFLLKTSILDRFCAPLCNALLEIGDWRLDSAQSPISNLQSPSSQDILEQLDHANLFLIPLDDERIWYRYHHLFADLLRQRLQSQEPEQLPQLHLRASRWLATNNYLAEAFDHALAANAIEEAVRLVQHHALKLFGRGEITLVVRWLKALPPSLIQSDPALCVLQAWLYYFAQRPKEAEHYLDLAQKLQADDQLKPEMLNRLAILRGWVARESGDTETAVTWHQRASGYLPDDHPGRGLNMLFLATALLRDGQVETAIAHYREGIERCLVNGSLAAAMGSAYGLANLYLVQGRLQEARHFLESQVAWAQARQLALSPSLGLVYVGLGRIYYELNEWETAVSHLQTAIKTNRYLTKTTTPAMLFLAWIDYWQGDYEAVEAALSTVETDLQRWDVSQDKTVIEAELVRLWLAMGRETAVAQWLSQHSSSHSEMHQMATARILLSKMISIGKIKLWPLVSPRTS